MKGKLDVFIFRFIWGRSCIDLERKYTCICKRKGNFINEPSVVAITEVRGRIRSCSWKEAKTMQ